MSNKAQTATEYMIILAIVIIIALIVAAILGELPGLGGATGDRTSKAYWESTEIAIPSYAVAENGVEDDLTLFLRNNRRDTIKITNIDVDDESVYSTEETIASGESKTISITDAGSYCNNGGDSFSLAINITYIDERTNEAYYETGRGHKLEGRCAN